VPIRNIKENDIDDLVDLHIESFKESLNILAGKIYLREVFRWFIKTNNIALLTYDGEGLTGYVIGAPIGYEKLMNRALWIYGLIGLLKNPTYFFNKKLIDNILKRTKSIMGLSGMKNQPLVSEKGFGISLVGIAVSEKNKGKGTAKELVIEFEKMAKNLDANFVRLSVLKENKRAQSFYEKIGWNKHETINGIYYFKELK
jgi:ribosomal protein S18 acetylase RimI-like enzyme